jgi:hypothetical protein
MQGIMQEHDDEEIVTADDDQPDAIMTTETEPAIEVLQLHTIVDHEANPAEGENEANPPEGAYEEPKTQEALMQIMLQGLMDVTEMVVGMTQTLANNKNQFDQLDKKTAQAAAETRRTRKMLQMMMVHTGVPMPKTAQEPEKTVAATASAKRKLELEEGREGKRHQSTGNQGATACTFYIEGKCRNGILCRFSHEKGAKEGTEVKEKETKLGGAPKLGGPQEKGRGGNKSSGKGRGGKGRGGGKGMNRQYYHERERWTSSP